MNKFWEWKDATNTLLLEGEISDITWFGDEVTPKAFRDDLSQHNGDLTVLLNSPGGDVFAGLSIYNALLDYEGTVTIKIDGIAASIASLVAMAGDKIIMSPGAMMMVHKPWSLVAGNADDLDSFKEILNNIENSIVPIYANRTGKTEDEIRQLLTEETWMTAEQAVEMKFADEMLEGKKSLSDSIKSALNGQFAFSMSATRKPLEQVLAKVRAKEEVIEEVIEEPKLEEPVKTEIKPTEEVIPEPVEPTVEVTTEKDKMNDEKEIVKDLVIPQDQPKVDAVKSVNYLNTKASMQDFANVLEQNAGKTGEDVRSAWKAQVLKMGLTDSNDILLPAPMVTAIEDAFKAGGEIWSKVTKTGLDALTVVIDTNESITSRAKGFTKGNTKAEQSIVIDGRTLRPQFIYKYLTLNKEDVRQNRNSGALLNYVMTELPQRIVREVERAIVIGDGRSSGDDRILSFISLQADAQSGNAYASTFTPTAGMTHYEAVARAKDLIKADGQAYLIAKKGYSTDARFAKDIDGKFLFPVGAKDTDIFNVAGVIEPDWFTDANEANYDAFVVVLSAYKTVGDNSIEAFSNFVLKENKNEYLQEIYQGGGLASLKAAVGIAAVSTS